MAESPWRCSQCGTINEPVANSCRTCGRWPSLFDLQDSVVEDDRVRAAAARAGEPQAYVPDVFEPETIQTQTFEPEPFEPEVADAPESEDEPRGSQPQEVDFRDRPDRTARLLRDLVLLQRPMMRRAVPAPESQAVLCARARRLRE